MLDGNQAPFILGVRYATVIPFAPYGSAIIAWTQKTLHPPGYGYEVAEWGILDREKFLMWVADTDTETVKAAKN